MRSSKEVSQDIVNTYAQIGEHRFMIRSNEFAIENVYKKLDVLHKELSEVNAVEKAVESEKAKLKAVPDDGSTP